VFNRTIAYRDKESYRVFCAFFVRRFNGIVINSGVGYRSFVELAEDDEINKIVEVNWLGVVKVCRAFISIQEAGKGHFINISSIAGLVNLPLGSFIMQQNMPLKAFLSVWLMS
jgi:short-subunit dehydrogenase